MTSNLVRSSAKVAGDGYRDKILHELEEYVKGLEEERLKIEAFKRELPFCMQLLSDVIGASEARVANLEEEIHLTEKEEKGLSPIQKPVEEKSAFTKRSCEEPKGDKSEEIQLKRKPVSANAEDTMPNWMSALQLWSHNHGTKLNSVSEQNSCPPQVFPSNPSKDVLCFKNRVGGAFRPFSKEKQGNPSNCDKGPSNDDSSNTNKSMETDQSKDEGISSNNGANPNPSPNDCHSTQRKTRRSWSPELHRQFVNALQQLGGADVATPKQIREVMKVDGLTNDEVKSHLQKYRLHTRRPSPKGSQSCISTSIQQSHFPPQLIVVGGIWVSPEYAAHPTSTGL